MIKKIIIMKGRKGRYLSIEGGKEIKNIHITGKKFMFLAVIAVFIITQVLLFSINFNQLFFHDYRRTPWNNENKKILTGDIFFTGDTFGKYGLIGCDRMGSITRRAKILKKFDDYLYLDFGNFTPDNPNITKAVVPIFLKAFKYMDLKVMNLTKRDLLNLTDNNVDLSNIHEIVMVSANIQVNPPVNLTNNKTGKVNREKPVTTCQLISFLLKNNEDIREITVGITGISNNERKLHKNKLNFKIKDIRQSLEQVLPVLDKADLKILLFNEIFFELKRLLMDGTIHFDLVIAYPTLPEHINSYTYINNTPVVFPDEYGRSLGHVRVYKNNHGFSFKFNWYELGMGIPEDKPMKALILMLKKRITNSKKTGKIQEQVTAINTSENNNEK